MNQPQELLTCRGITKRFGPVVANSDVALHVRAGQIQALLGENGAGKSTLMSILAGRYLPDAGEILVRNEPVRFTCPADAMRSGIGMVYQRFMLVEGLSVGENICLAAQSCGINARKAAARTRELIERFGLGVSPRTLVADLSMGERQRVEILKLLVQDAQVLIFDEPTAVLSQPEIERLFEIFDRLRRDGRGIVFITHKLEEVLAVADFISILRRGRIIAGFRPSELDSRRELARLMVGREFVFQVDKPALEPAETVMELRDFSGTDATGRLAFENVNLRVRRGEIFAVIGVAGNGQSALAAAITGRSDAGCPVSGEVVFQGDVTPASKWRGAAKLAYVPEDRHHAGSVADMSLAENFALTRLAFGGFWLDEGSFQEQAQAAINEFHIRATGPNDRAGSLSGGNLQKLILARELSGSPALFVAEQPTQGLDIASTEEVWAALIRQREQSGVLLFSGDLKEVLSLADRIAVLFRGKILAELDALDADAMGRIGLLMAGGGEA